MKLKLLLSYTGTNYCGWQIQEYKTRTSLPTIQGEVEKAFSQILGTPTKIIGASRTDTGVHAQEQCAHCDLPFIPTHEIKWQKALNRYLPRDIRVTDISIVPDTFHAQFDSVGKLYTYALWTNPAYTPPRLYPYVWSCHSLNFDAMVEAIPFFLGTKDFVAFQNKGTEIRHTVRTLHNISYSNPEEYCHNFLFYGNGFLKQMVRNLMGCLVQVGLGRLKKEDLPEIFESGHRKHHFPTAPAQGLTLDKVLYE